MMRLLDQKVAKMKQEVIVEISQKYDARIGTVTFTVEYFFNIFFGS